MNGDGGPEFDPRYDPRMAFGRWYRRVEIAGRQPRWVTRTALAAAVVVIVVPLLVLALAGIAVGLIVFAALGLVAWGVSWIKGLLYRWDDFRFDSGRRNVRVIRRE